MADARMESSTAGATRRQKTPAFYVCLAGGWLVLMLYAGWLLHNLSPWLRGSTAPPLPSLVVHALALPGLTAGARTPWGALTPDQAQALGWLVAALMGFVLLILLPLTFRPLPGVTRSLGTVAPIPLTPGPELVGLAGLVVATPDSPLAPQATPLLERELRTERLEAAQRGESVAPVKPVTLLEGREQRVFISHSSGDNAFGVELARRIAEWLGSADAVFYDSDGGLVGGDDFLARLQHEITERDVFVVLLSPQAFASNWVEAEINLAVRQERSVGGKTLIPVLVQPTPIWPFLQAYQWVDFTTQPYDAAFDELCAAIALGRSRYRDVERMRLARLGPPYDLDLLPLPERYVGRARDLERAQALLAVAPATPDGLGGVVAAHGLAGIGKSAFAGRLSRLLRAAAQFPDGIAAVRCEGLTNPATVLRRVLARFDAQGRAPQETDLGELRDRARWVFGDRRAMVVLDNVESDWPVDEVVKALRVAGAAVLLTSRAALPERAVPASASLALAALEDEEPVELFALYAGYGSAQELGEAERDAMRRITRALGDHTLAIKLAAAHVRGRDLEALARAYEANPRLGVHVRDGVEAVEVVLASSVAQLPAVGQRLFDALASFATPEMGRNAVTTLASALGDARPEESIEALARWHLVDAYVAVDLPGDADRERLALHPLVWAFAQERFAEWPMDGREQTRAAAARYLGAYAEKWQRASGTLEADVGNLMGALEWAGGAGETESVVALAHGLRRFWRARGRYREGLTYLALGVSASQSAAEHAQHVEEREVGAEGALVALDRREFDLRLAYGMLLVDSSHLEESERELEAALSGYRALGDRRGEGEALSGQAALDIQRGQFEAAQEVLQTSLAIRIETQDRAGEGTDLGLLGEVAMRRGRNDEAMDYAQRSLAICREVEDELGEGENLTRLGQVAMRLARFEEAVGYLRQSLDYARRQRDSLGEGSSLVVLGQVETRLWRLDAAEEHLDQSLVVLRAVGDRQGVGVVLGMLGQVALGRARLTEAEDYLNQALVVSLDLQDQHSEAIHTHVLGAVAVQRGRLTEAEARLQQARTLIAALKDAGGEAGITGDLGLVAFERGDLDEAERRLEEARAMMREQKDTHGEARELTDLAKLALRRGHLDEAETLVEQARVMFDGLRDTHSVARALLTRGDVRIAQGRHEEAERDLRQALEVFRAGGARRWEARCLWSLGHVAQARQEAAAAENYYRESLTLATAGDLRPELARAQRDLGVLLVEERQEREEGSALLRAAARSFTEMGMPGEAQDAEMAIQRAMHGEDPR